MRSRAHIKTHPLHPILVAFPIALFTGTVAFDLLGILKEEPSFHVTAEHMLIGGVAMAVVAAIPGLIDYLHTVPPESSAKNRASTHAFLNVSMLALFGTALVYRLTNIHPEPMVYLLLEAGAYIIMSVAGWLGGTLVHRNQIGIDHRYAFSGKWRELHGEEEQGRIRLGAVNDLKRDQMILVHAGKKRIVLGRTEQGYVAFDDRCTHKGGSLAGGMMMCGSVQCPWHGSQFDALTGEVKAGPANSKIKTYSTEMISNVLYINLG
jgi:uncharacterized membrane protein/nitrite reductase/ring-hydroxylating ferredoxin subunit